MIRQPREPYTRKLIGAVPGWTEDKAMEKILEVTNLKKTFYKNKSPFTAVNEISFTLNRGEMSGACRRKRMRKKYTAKMITRLLEPDSGSIRLDGEKSWDRKGKRKKSCIQRCR